MEHPDCSPRPGRALGFNNMAMAFVVFFAGVAAAAGLWVAEWAWKWAGKREGRLRKYGWIENE